MNEGRQACSNRYYHLGGGDFFPPDSHTRNQEFKPWFIIYIPLLLPNTQFSFFCILNTSSYLSHGTAVNEFAISNSRLSALHFLSSPPFLNSPSCKRNSLDIYGIFVCAGEIYQLCISSDQLKIHLCKKKRDRTSCHKMDA